VNAMIVLIFVMFTVTSAESDNNTFTIQRLNVKHQMTSIVYLLKVCNYNKQTPIEEFRAFWHGPFARNLSKCTLGNIGFNPEDNVIVEMSIPCQFESVLDGKIVDNTLLDEQNYNYYNTEWAYYAVNNTQFNTDKYKYRMIIIPKNTPAKFYGLGSLGCYSDGCYTWYNTNQYVSNLFLHEMGHNFGLHHSRSEMAEYGDFTCVMGNQQNRCWNAAHRYALGWSEPLRTLSLKNNSQSLVQSSFMLSVGQFIRVNNNIFVEHIDLTKQPNIVPKSIQVYELSADMSTLHMCFLLRVGDVCKIKQDIQIALKIESMDSNKIIVSICLDACKNTTITSNSKSSKSCSKFKMQNGAVIFAMLIAFLLMFAQIR
jgi:hypothetical protein